METNIAQQLMLWWMYEKGQTIRELSKALGTSTATIYSWQRKPGGAIPLKHIKRVTELTKGKFTVKDLYPEVAKKLMGSGD